MSYSLECAIRMTTYTFRDIKTIFWGQY